MVKITKGVLKYFDIDDDLEYNKKYEEVFIVNGRNFHKFYKNSELRYFNSIVESDKRIKIVSKSTADKIFKDFKWEAIKEFLLNNAPGSYYKEILSSSSLVTGKHNTNHNMYDVAAIIATRERDNTLEIDYIVDTEDGFKINTINVTYDVVKRYRVVPDFPTVITVTRYYPDLYFMKDKFPISFDNYDIIDYLKENNPWK